MNNLNIQHLQNTHTHTHKQTNPNVTHGQTNRCKGNPSHWAPPSSRSPGPRPWRPASGTHLSADRAPTAAHGTGSGCCGVYAVQCQMHQSVLYSFSIQGGPERMQQLWLLILRTLSMKQNCLYFLFGRTFIFQQNDTMIINFGQCRFQNVLLFRPSGSLEQQEYFTSRRQMLRNE